MSALLTCSDAAESGSGVCYCRELNDTSTASAMSDPAAGKCGGRDFFGVVGLFGGHVRIDDVRGVSVGRVAFGLVSHSRRRVKRPGSPHLRIGEIGTANRGL